MFDRWRLAGLTAAAVTTATFAKAFVPFYLIGSTAIFAVTSASGIALLAIDWRRLRDNASHVADILVLLGLFYGVVIISYVASSYPAVPVTHLLGILIFHALFISFGFAAARAMKVVLWMLLGAAAVYSIVIAQYTLRFGDLMRDGYLHDVFGVGISAIFITFHQNIGSILGLAALAALGLSSNRMTRILAIGVLPLVLLFMFHIAARTALVALVCSLVFLPAAALWVRSRKLAVLSVTVIVVAAIFASAIFYRRALQDKAVDALAPDAISRTIRELQDPRPLFRMQIWDRAWHRILSEPNRILIGRGVGMFPVDEGYGPPDWLLRQTEGAKHYPHNIYLERLYETGITGLLLFGILTLYPLLISLRRWHLLSPTDKSSVSMYLFNLVSVELSGALAFSYDFQFFFALMIGMIALQRADNVAAPGLTQASDAVDPTHPRPGSLRNAGPSSV